MAYLKILYIEIVEGKDCNFVSIRVSVAYLKIPERRWLKIRKDLSFNTR